MIIQCLVPFSVEINIEYSNFWNENDIYFTERIRQQILVQTFCPQPPPTPIPLTLEVGSVGKNALFSENGPVAYHIKGYHECSNIVAIILHTLPPKKNTHTHTHTHTPPWTQGIGSIGQNSTFQTVVILHFKLNGITNAAIW